MNMESNHFQDRNARRPGQQGARSSGVDQPESEKFATGHFSAKQRSTLYEFMNTDSKKNKGKRTRPSSGSGSQSESDKRTRQDESSCESSSDMESSSSTIYKSKGGTAHWARFLVMTGKNDLFKNLHAFAVTKGIKGIAGDVKNIKRLRSGDLLIEVISPSQSRSLLKAKSLNGCPIEVTMHRTLNYCKGVVRSYETLTCEEDRIRDNLSDFGVVAVQRIVNRVKGPTPVLIVTFCGDKLPSSIKMGFENCRVTPYIPYPLRCFNCQQFGHHGKSCAKSSVCAKCSGKGHSSSHDTPCQNEARCANCSGMHPAFDRSCPVWKQEQEVQRLKVMSNISYPEARRMITASNQTPTFASVVKKSICNAATQTEEMFLQNNQTATQAVQTMTKTQGVQTVAPEWHHLTISPVTNASVAGDWEKYPSPTLRTTPKEKIVLDPSFTYSKSHTGPTTVHDDTITSVTAMETSVVSFDGNKDVVEPHVDSVASEDSTILLADAASYSLDQANQDHSGESSADSDSDDKHSSPARKKTEIVYDLDQTWRQRFNKFLANLPSHDDPDRTSHLLSFYMDATRVLQSFDMQTDIRCLKNRYRSKPGDWPIDRSGARAELQHFTDLCQFTDHEYSVLIVLVLHGMYLSALRLAKLYKKG